MDQKSKELGWIMIEKKEWELLRVSDRCVLIPAFPPTNCMAFDLPQTLSVQFSPVAQSCPTLCLSSDCSTPGLPVHRHLPEFTQTPVHWVGDAIQPSHPVIPFSSQSFPASGSFQMSQFSSISQNWAMKALVIIFILNLNGLLWDCSKPTSKWKSK